MTDRHQQPATLIRMDEDTHNEIRRVAENEHKKIAVWIREAIHEKLERRKKTKR